VHDYLSAVIAESITNDLHAAEEASSWV